MFPHSLAKDQLAPKENLLQRLTSLSWRDLGFVLIPIVLLAITAIWVAVKLFQPAPPDTLVILSGPVGSSFESTAQRYAKIIATHGIKVKVVTTEGSEQNLDLLMNKRIVADVALVQNGLADKAESQALMSLGTLYVQPILVFYRSKENVDHIAQFKHKRIAIGPEGSGTHTLATKILAENELGKDDASLLTMDGDDAIQALLTKKVDAIFVMSELIRGKQVRELMKAPGVKLMSFRQAEGYLRQMRFLSRLTAPEGSFDLGLNLPPHDVELIGTPVELVAREGLHPAISDLLISAAREVHGKSGMFRKPNEFPAAVERDFPLSEEAKRYYASGSPFLYKRLPFWLASLIDRILLFIVPLAIVLVPASKLLAPLYRWRVRSKIYRWYGALMVIEREMSLANSAERSGQIRTRLAEIETAVDAMHAPLAYADQLYVLREHIGFVKKRFSPVAAG
jgi:TRAP transporter TAXI family solute receptor